MDTKKQVSHHGGSCVSLKLDMGRGWAHSGAIWWQCPAYPFSLHSGPGRDGGLQAEDVGSGPKDVSGFE